MALIQREQRPQEKLAHRHGKPSEDTATRRLITDHGDSPPRNHAPDPWGLDFSLQSCEKVNFRCVSHAVYGPCRLTQSLTAMNFSKPQQRTGTRPAVLGGALSRGGGQRPSSSHHPAGSFGCCHLLRQRPASPPQSVPVVSLGSIPPRLSPNLPPALVPVDTGRCDRDRPRGSLSDLPFQTLASTRVNTEHTARVRGTGCAEGLLVRDSGPIHRSRLAFGGHDPVLIRQVGLERKVFLRTEACETASLGCPAASEETRVSFGTDTAAQDVSCTKFAV